MGGAIKAAVAVIDGLTEIIGRVSGWALFLVGFTICYEVLMRYVFRSPTSWVSEVSLLTQVFVVFFAAAYVMKHREMVTIELLFKRTDTPWRKVSETFAILMLFCFTAPAIYFGFEIWMRAIESGHTTDTILRIPKWITEFAVWGGMSVLSLQALAELWRIWAEGIPEADDDPLEGSH